MQESYQDITNVPDGLSCTILTFIQLNLCEVTLAPFCCFCGGGGGVDDLWIYRDVPKIAA
jgi:hypothetical protein